MKCCGTCLYWKCTNKEKRTGHCRIISKIVKELHGIGCAFYGDRIEGAIMLIDNITTRCVSEYDIEALQLAKEVLRKQRPQKVIKARVCGVYESCPSCKSEVRGMYNFCTVCGQKLDFS